MCHMTHSIALERDDLSREVQQLRADARNTQHKDDSEHRKTVLIDGYECEKGPIRRFMMLQVSALATPLARQTSARLHKRCRGMPWHTIHHTQVDDAESAMYLHIWAWATWFAMRYNTPHREINRQVCLSYVTLDVLTSSQVSMLTPIYTNTLSARACICTWYDTRYDTLCLCICIYGYEHAHLA